MDMLSNAIALAATAHAGQRHGRGTQIEHCLRVMMQMDVDDEKVVAVLHDVIEDTNTTFQDLENACIDSYLSSMIGILTRRTEEDYFDYVRRCRRTELTRKVKLADNWDNGSRLLDSGMSVTKVASLIKRYAKARRILNFEED